VAGLARTREVSRPIYRGLYFNPDRADDLEILRWLLAMPRSQRSRAIKAVLLAGLPAYVAVHYPNQTAPAAKEVPSRLAAASRSTSPRDTGRPALAAASPVAASAPSFAPEPGPVMADRASDAERPGDEDARAAAEAKLDLLVRSFVK
jgi:hypothetical protein